MKTGSSVGVPDSRRRCIACPDRAKLTRPRSKLPLHLIANLGRHAATARLTGSLAEARLTMLARAITRRELRAASRREQGDCSIVEACLRRFVGQRRYRYDDAALEVD